MLLGVNNFKSQVDKFNVKDPISLLQPFCWESFVAQPKQSMSKGLHHCSCQYIVPTIHVS